MVDVSLPRCDEARAFAHRLLTGEARGALGYVVPLYDDSFQVPAYSGQECEASVEKWLEKNLAELRHRRWGHDHGVPLLDPSRLGTDIISSVFGSRYSWNPKGTAPVITDADAIGSLPLDRGLDDGLVPEALATVVYARQQVGDRVGMLRYHAGDHCSSAGMVVKNAELLTAMYTHPQAVHRFLETCNELLIGFFKAQQKLAPGISMSSVYDVYWPDDVGIYTGSDWLAPMSPRIALEFEIPYLNRMSEEFGGVVVHSCGNYEHQFELLKKHVRNLRGIWINAGECSIHKAVEVFRGTDVVIFVRWVLNSPHRFASRLDFVKQILAAKTPDVSLFLQAHSLAEQRGSDPSLPEELDHNAVSEEILRLIERYVATGVVD